MKLVRLSVCVLLLSVAASAFAALSKEYADFDKGPAQYLLTPEERAQWKNVKNDDAAKAFIELFWARRDPTPGTAANENRQLFDERVKVADANFREPNRVGSKTDRGKVFILLGSPTKIIRSDAGPKSTIQNSPFGSSAPSESGPGGSASSPFPGMTNDTSIQSYSPKELWTFEQGKISYTLGQPLVDVAFIDQYGSNDWKLEKVISTDYKSFFERVAKNVWVAQPDLTEVPKFTATAAAAAPVSIAVPAAPAALTAFTTDAYRVAVEEARATKDASKTLFLTYGEYVTPTGEHYVPVQLWAPASAGLTAETPVTFFGLVENAAGERVQLIEEPVTLTASKGDVFYARSLTLPAGSYRGTFGLAKEGKPVSVVSQPLVVSGLDKDAPGISQLILAAHIYPLTEAQQPTDPYAFGGLKIVPKSDFTFKRSDELWYFVEARNPGKDATTGQPSFTMAVTLTGTTKEGKPVKMIGPGSAVQAQEMKGVPGHFAIGQAMPLESFKPGQYTLAIKLTDTVLNKTYELKESFRVVE